MTVQEAAQEAMLATPLADKKYIFSTPFTISQERQKEIIAYTLSQGNVIAPAEGVKCDPFWISIGLTEVPRKNSAHVPKEFLDRWYYFNRMNASLEWTWTDTPITAAVQQLLIPLQDYFKCVTRVSILVQIPHKRLPAHRDLVPFNEYAKLRDNHLSYWGDKTLMYEGDSWFAAYREHAENFSHEGQEYLNLKIPISENPKAPGLPYIQRDGERLYYNSENHLFFLNEAEVEHGADAVDFYRGVVIVDGVFNVQNFKNLPRSSMKTSSLAADIYPRELTRD